jgi:hypothetical protein
MSGKNYIGKCKKIGKWATGVGLPKDKCVFNEKGWLNIVVVHNSDDPDRDAYAYIDDWKPDSTKKEEKEQQNDAVKKTNDNFPF